MHGGKREGAGRPKKYGEPLKRMVIYCPQSKEIELKQLINEKLKHYETNK